MFLFSFYVKTKSVLFLAFIINLVPILIFCATCLLAKSDHQLTLAMLLSVAYAVVMVAVIVSY